MLVGYSFDSRIYARKHADNGFGERFGKYSRLFYCHLLLRFFGYKGKKKKPILIASGEWKRGGEIFFREKKKKMY